MLVIMYYLKACWTRDAL